MVSFLPVVVLALTAVANAQNSTYLSGLLQTLNGAGLTSLASAIGLVNSTGPGSQLLASLSDQSKNFTVFAPNNDACKSACFCYTAPRRVVTLASSLQCIEWYHPRPQCVDRCLRIPYCVWSFQ